MSDTPKKETKPTERVVLKQITSDELNGIARPAWAPICKDESTEVRIFHATSKKQAIEQYAGKKGKDHPGTYRAPSLSAWREEHTFKPSDEPLMVEEVKP